MSKHSDKKLEIKELEKSRIIEPNGQVSLFAPQLTDWKSGIQVDCYKDKLIELKIHQNPAKGSDSNDAFQSIDELSKEYPKASLLSVSLPDQQLVNTFLSKGFLFITECLELMPIAEKVGAKINRKDIVNNPVIVKLLKPSREITEINHHVTSMSFLERQEIHNRCLFVIKLVNDIENRITEIYDIHKKWTNNPEQKLQIQIDQMALELVQIRETILRLFAICFPHFVSKQNYLSSEQDIDVNLSVIALYVNYMRKLEFCFNSLVSNTGQWRAIEILSK